MTDPQLSLIVTDRIDPRTQVTRMPGTDAVCECPTTGIERIAQECLWPFCDWKKHMPPTEEDE